MKRTVLALLCIAFILTLSPLVCASESLPMIIDHAELLTLSEKDALLEKIQPLCQEYNIDVVILTVHSLNGARAQVYAEDYYDQNGYSDNGLLYLLSMEEREWYISTCGSMIYSLTDYGTQMLGESMLPFLSEEDYAAAFSVLLENLPIYLNAYAQKEAIDGYATLVDDYYHADQNAVAYSQERSTSSKFLTSVIIGVVTGGLAVLVMVFSMNTKRKQRGASTYIMPGSYQVTRHQDLYLYSNVSKVRRQQNTSSGGGSSVHRSSSGRRHGGGGGKF